MKRTRICICNLLLLFIVFANNSYGQTNTTDFRDKLKVGVKAGINYSNVYATQGEAFNSTSRVGFVTGLFFAIPINKIMGVQPEILISQKGFHATGIILNNTYDLTRTTSYIDVPILFALKPSEFFTILAGPQYSYLIKQNDAFANVSTSIEQERLFETDHFRKSTVGFQTGFDATLKHILLSARVGWDLFQNNADGDSTTPRYKNRWYQFTLGYRF